MTMRTPDVPEVVEPLGPHAITIDDGAFMSVQVLIGGCVYLRQGPSRIVLSREALPLLRAALTPPTDARELAAFGASDAACYLYPGEDQSAERAAYCAGAAHAVPADAREDALAANDF